MNGLDEDSTAPQTFLYGCQLDAGKDVVFDPDDDDFEHHLDLRMACVDPSTKDELHVVEAEGQDIEGQKTKAIIVSFKPSTLPSVCLGGFAFTPPVTFRLKTGSGPVHLSGQHLVMGIDQSFVEEDDDEEEEEEEDLKDVKTSKKRPAMSPVDKSKKKMKMEVDEDDDDDEDDDEEGEEDDDEDEDEEETPVKAVQQVAKPKAAAQNGKSPKPQTPGKNEAKTPKGKGEKSPKTPTTPKEPLTLQQIKDKMIEKMKKGVTLPKAQVKFENFVKNSFKVMDSKVIGELWKWSQTVKDVK